MRTTLKVFSVLYWITVGLFILFAILAFVSGSALDSIKEAMAIDLQGADPKIVFGVSFIIIAIINAITAVSMRNVATKKSNGTVALVLLAISAIGGIYYLISAFSISTLISFVITAMLLYFVICVRKENEAK